MHQGGSRTVAEQEDETDRALLAVLLDDGSPMWSIEELVRFMGNRIDVADSLARL